MPVSSPEFAIKLVTAATWTPGGVDFLPITVTGADIDLTDPDGVTGGYSCRAVQIGGTAGNLVVMTLRSGGLDTPASRTIPVAANSTVQVGACVIAGSANGTTCTPVGVYL